MRGPSGGSLAPPVLAGVLLAEGFASLGAEILALRRMLPWAGSAVTVTSLLLSAYLLALAAGYRRGGALAALPGARRRLSARLAAAAALCALWLSEPGVRLVLQAPLPPLGQVALYSAAVAPVGFLLAECVLLAHACSPRGQASLTAGRVFAASTAGNVAGALGTAFVLLPLLGTAAATLAVVAALLAASLAARPAAPLSWAGAAAAVLATAVPLLELGWEATHYIERNAHADYRTVRLPDGGNVLLVSEQAASRHDAAGRAWPYIERFERTLCEAGETRVLALGAAGMTMGRAAPCRLEITFVDVDPAQEEIAAQVPPAWPPPPQGSRFRAADARAFLRGGPGGWDAIVADAYTHALSQPGHLLTAEFYREARAALREGGALYVNQLSWPAQPLFRTRAERTLRSVFADCSTWRVSAEVGRGWFEGLQASDNLLFRCRKDSSLDGDTAIYSDALPRSDMDLGLRRLGAPAGPPAVPGQ